MKNSCHRAGQQPGSIQDRQKPTLFYRRFFPDFPKGWLSFGYLLLLVLWGCHHSNPRPPYTNHLISENSPYLLQHAHNPVDWYPWGEEALAKARREDKMLLISIGYAACHWCHVMERESFQDTAVARLMNTYFVPVKVDREERPDVDGVYLDACQTATGQPCGWPLHAFALPDGRPVWAGTYFPKKQWIEILRYFADLQYQEKEKLNAYAGRLLTELTQLDRLSISPRTTDRFSLSDLSPIVSSFLKEADWRRGGSAGAPKFPMPGTLSFLLAYHYVVADPAALRLVRLTLDEMARGGIYDQLDGGFARYATDADWHVPHFEKMLYDNAQLVSLYAKAYQVSGDSLYRTVVEETLSFIRRKLTSPEGAFYSSIDADSDGEEGRYYLWTNRQVDSILGQSPATTLFSAYYGITPKGNWENGRNILDPERSLSAVADSLNLPVETARRYLSEARRQLLAARDRRPSPRLDDKILTAWNALMIMAYLDAYNALGDPDYLEAARHAGRFLLRQQQPDGRLLRVYRAGRAGTDGFLDDYALTAQAFVALYQATFEEDWLRPARKLADFALKHFRAPETGLCWYTSDQAAPLVARRLDLEDNVVPSSNSALARVLFDLGQLLYRNDYLEQARRMLDQVSGAFSDGGHLSSYANWGQLYLQMVHPPYEVAIVGPDCLQLRAGLMRHYLPQALFLGGRREGTLELLKGKLSGKETLIYVCQNKVCRLPVSDPDQALQQLSP